MKKIFIFSSVFFLCYLINAQEELGIKNAKVTFNFSNNDVDGSFSGFESTSNIDLDNPSNSTFEGSVAVETIKTGNFLRTGP